MSPIKLDITTRKINPTTCILDIQGEVTGSAESILMDAFTQATAAGAQAVILNFSGLEYMNSSGIGLLVTLLIRTQRQKQRLLAYGLNEHYRQIFELTQLARLSASTHRKPRRWLSLIIEAGWRLRTTPPGASSSRVPAAQELFLIPGRVT